MKELSVALVALCAVSCCPEQAQCDEPEPPCFVAEGTYRPAIEHVGGDCPEGEHDDFFESRRQLRSIGPEERECGLTVRHWESEWAAYESTAVVVVTTWAEDSITEEWSMYLATADDLICEDNFIIRYE